LGRNVSVTEWIDQRKVSKFQVLVILLCALVALVEGFDLLAISFVAPEIARLWNVDVGAFGPVFAAGLVGLMVGTTVFGPIADRFGRKKVIILSTFAFGLSSLLTIFAGNLNELIIYRFITGLGIGGAMPNVIALTAEYVPKRIRTTGIAIMLIGQPIGSLLGGISAAQMISSFGWESVFVLGGIVPIILSIILIVALPESTQFLVAKGTETGKVTAILNKMDPSTKLDSNVSYYLQEEKIKGMPVKHLFGHNRTRNTILLWIVFFLNLMSMYFLQNWMPAVFNKAGFTTEKAVITSMMMQVGAIVGGLVVSRLGDKIAPRTVLAWFYLLAAISVGAIGMISNQALLMFIVFLAGASVIGSQFLLNGLAAVIYPTRVRSTGIGWALGVGRIGSILGPIAGGIILSLGWSTSGIFYVAAIPLILNIIAVSFIVSQNPKEVPIDISKDQVNV
jgi:MFS transporter, AAHS family, 4-hydroxybenzoate transporter